MAPPYTPLMIAQLDGETARRWGRRVPQSLISVGPILTCVLVVFTMPDDAGLGMTSGTLVDVVGFLLVGALAATAFAGVAQRIPAQVAIIVVCALFGAAGSPVALVMLTIWATILGLDLWNRARQARLIRALSQPSPIVLDPLPPAPLRTRLMDGIWAALAVAALAAGVLVPLEPALLVAGIALTVAVRRPISRAARRRGLLRTAASGRPLRCRLERQGDDALLVLPADGKAVAIVRGIRIPDRLGFDEGVVRGLDRDGAMAIIDVGDQEGATIRLLGTKPVRDPWLADLGDLDPGLPHGWSALLD